MTKIKLMEMVIKQVKELAKPGEIPMAYAMNKKGGLTLSCIAVKEKYEMKMALYGIMVATGCKELVFVNEAWMAIAKDKNNLSQEPRPSENPNRKECFVINYFSKDKCLVHVLIFERDKKDNNKLVWIDEKGYEDSEKGEVESVFNPFKMTEEDLKRYIAWANQDTLRKEGKKETIELAFNYHMDIYRKDGKFFFELFNHKGEVFQSVPVCEETPEMKKKLNEFLEMLNTAEFLTKGDENANK